MRVMLGLTMGLLTLSGLAACGQSEQQLRNTTREGLLLGCRNGDASDRAILNQAGVDINRYCACAADRFIQSASAEQLKQLSRNPGAAAADPGMLRAAEQCMREQMPPTAPTPAAANQSAAEPAAPAEGAPAEGGAPAEENETEQ